MSQDVVATAVETLQQETGAEVRRLTVHAGEVLAVIMPEGFAWTADNVEKLQRMVQRSDLPFQVVFLEHCTELAVVRAEESGQ